MLLGREAIKRTIFYSILFYSILFYFLEYTGFLVVHKFLLLLHRTIQLYH